MTTTPNTELLAMNQKTYDRVYADCQAGGMNATDCDQIAREHAMTTTPNTEYTPGPWIALERYTNRQAVPIGRQRSALAHDIFAEAHGHNCEANARLIAAAPEQNAALQAIDKLTCNCPCMSREAQEGFASHPALEAYRVEVAKLILAIREQARAALAKAA